MLRPPIHLWTCHAELVRLEGGHRNTVFRTIGLKQDLVFKSTRRPPEAVSWVDRVQRLARESGFVVPDLRPSQKGRLVEQGWTCEPFIDGTAFQPGDLPSILGKIETLQTLAGGFSQRPGFCSARDLMTCDRGGDIDLTQMPEGLVTTCRVAWRGLQDAPNTVVHGDLNPGNLLWTVDGRAALLDWDESRVDHVVFDLARLRTPSDAERRALDAWEVACSWLLEPDHATRVAQRLK